MPFSFYNPPILSPEQANPFASALSGALSGYGQMQGFQKQKEEIQKAIYQNMLEKERSQFYPRTAKAETELAEARPGYMGAQTGYLSEQAKKMHQMTPLEAKELELKNQFYPELTKAMINMYNMGGRGGFGVGGKEELMFQNLIGKDNPHLKPEEVYEASNILRNGGTEMPDGRPINLSPASRESWNRIVKSGTTGSLISQAITAQQASAEEKVMSNMAEKDFAPYATTYAGYSIPQIVDTFKTDNESQDRLGKFIASQAIQYEIAQIRNRMAGGVSGITAIHELMGASEQVIKKLYPSLSARARKKASQRLDEYLEEGLKARMSVGIGASQATGNKPFTLPNPNAPSESGSLMSGEKRRNISSMSTQEIEKEIQRLKGNK